jgi:hypothetical protein
LAIGLCGLLLVVGIAIAPMLQHSYPITHSTQFNLSWAFQVQRQMASGQIYPRWLEFSNFGFGNATFAFYPPLCMVATLPFRLLGLDLPASLIGSMALAVALLGGGLYRYARCFFPAWISLGVAGMGMISPYFWVDIYQRGAIGEVWAIVCLPWILWASQQVRDRPEKLWPVVALAFSYGLLVLSHLPTLLLFTLVWILFPWVQPSPQQQWHWVRRCYLAALLAFGWTAFYLWPATLDQRFIQVGSINADPEYQPQNRLMLSGLWHFHPRLTEHWFESGLIGSWWWMVAVILLSALVWILWQHPRSPWSHPCSNQGLEALDSPSSLPRAALYWIVISLVALLMMTDLLGWVYSLSLTLRRIQFSWRWMSILSITAPLLIGYLLQVARLQPKRGLSLALGMLCLGLMTVGTWQAFSVRDQANYQPDTVARFAQLAAEKQFPQEPKRRPGRDFIYWHWIFADGLALVDVPEYRARGVTMPMPPAQVDPLLVWQNGTVQNLEMQQWWYGVRRFTATNASASPQQVLLRTFYYPAWRVQLDGRFVPTEKTDLGQIQVTIPPGQHQVTVRYLGTLMDWIGRGASGLTIIGYLGWWRRQRQKQILRLEIPR